MPLLVLSRCDNLCQHASLKTYGNQNIPNIIVLFKLQAKEWKSDFKGITRCTVVATCHSTQNNKTPPPQKSKLITILKGKKNPH